MSRSSFKIQTLGNRFINEKNLYFKFTEIPNAFPDIIFLVTFKLFILAGIITIYFYFLIDHLLHFP